MLDPNNKIDANSTLEALPRRQLLLKFLASLILVGFLLGLMLGKVLHPTPAVTKPNTVEQLLSYSEGLSLCLQEPAQLQEITTQGMYQLLLINTVGRAARGELELARDQRITWRLEPHDGYMQIAFVGLKPILGQWYVRTTPEHWCVDVKIRSEQNVLTQP